MSADELADVLVQLEIDRPDVADELKTLQAIYGNENLQLANPGIAGAGCDKLLELKVNLPLMAHQDVSQTFLITIMPGYPATEPPRLQLLGNYIGNFPIPKDLSDRVLKTYSNAWQTDTPAIFDGIEQAREACDIFYNLQLEQNVAQVTASSDHRTSETSTTFSHVTESSRDLKPVSAIEDPLVESVTALKHPLYSSQPILDRKSVFIGHACQIESPTDVKAVVAALLADKKIAKAAHPAILAYRCTGPGGILYRDNDDDGETAAGSRLAHLLQILDLENVLVVVTRWYGGVHLGSDRFKRINDAARQALIEAGLASKSSQPRQR